MKKILVLLMILITVLTFSENAVEQVYATESSGECGIDIRYTFDNETGALTTIAFMKHAVKSVKLEAASKSVKAGKSVKVKATVKTTGISVNKTLKWSSSNTNYATVTSKGVVKTKKVGKGKTVTITVTSTDGTNKKAKVKIKIKLTT